MCSCSSVRHVGICSSQRDGTVGCARGGAKSVGGGRRPMDPEKVEGDGAACGAEARFGV